MMQHHQKISSWWVWLVIGLPVVFLIYLGVTSRMDISCDAIGYENIGRILQQKGWAGYLSNGPQREPVYPLSIALSMSLASLLGISFFKIQTALQIGLIFLSMGMLWKLLRRIEVPFKIAACCVAYFGLSPAIMNSALSLYAEIVTYPLILGIILVSLSLYSALRQQQLVRALIQSALLGVLMTLMTLSKGTFELVAPLYGMFFLLIVWGRLRVVSGGWRGSYILIIGLSLLIWGTLVGEYKMLNKAYNGNYVLTDRGPRHFYGNMIMRTQPLTKTRLKAALASVPGDGVCRAVSAPEDCAFWNFQQCDFYGMQMLDQISKEGKNIETANKKLIALSIEGIGTNPLQYTALTLLESLKMFFWESTKVGFVTYPDWLDKLYDKGLFKNGLRLVITLATVLSFGWILFQGSKLPVGIALTACLAVLFILTHALGSVLTRYAFPVVPLYMGCIAYWLSQVSWTAWIRVFKNWNFYFIGVTGLYILWRLKIYLLH